MRLSLIAFALASRPAALAAEPARWSGVDEVVVERLADEAGRKRWRTFLDDSGDLPLFVFLWAGILGGFTVGYAYRALFSERPSSSEEEK